MGLHAFLCLLTLTLIIRNLLNIIKIKISIMNEQFSYLTSQTIKICGVLALEGGVINGVLTDSISFISNSTWHRTIYFILGY